MKLWFDKWCDTYRVNYPGYVNGRAVEDDFQITLGPPEDHTVINPSMVVSADTDKKEVVLLYSERGGEPLVPMKFTEEKMGLSVRWREFGL